MQLPQILDLLHRLNLHGQNKPDSWLMLTARSLQRTHAFSPALAFKSDRASNDVNQQLLEEEREQLLSEVQERMR